ncbi:MAG: YojF family protein [Heyndrickxia sp.]
MEPINMTKVQEKINEFANEEVYIHLETTNGAYASHFNESFFSAGAYIRNAKVKYEHGKITGDGPFRVGLKTEIGWIYAEGITHYEVDEQNRLLLAGHGYDGKLAVALEISKAPFEI